MCVLRPLDITSRTHICVLRPLKVNDAEYMAASYRFSLVIPITDIFVLLCNDLLCFLTQQ
jgi:hypothetical protein